MQRIILSGAVLTGLLPMAAAGQTTGVSRPEQVTITATPELVQPGTVYEATPAVVLTPHTMSATDEPVYRPTPAGVTLRTRPVETALPAAAVSGQASDANAMVASSGGRQVRTGDVDGLIVGDPLPAGSIAAETGVTLNADPDANVVTQLTGGANELPAGTIFKVRMAEGFSTESTAAGTAFTAALTEPVLRDGRVLLPAGSVLNGRVTDVHSGQRISGPATIHLQPMAVTLPDGTRYKLSAQVIDTDETRRVKVDREGTIVGKDHARGTAAVVGLAAGSGVAAGAMIAGVPGAVVGGLVGAGIATVVWLKHDRQTDVPAGTVVVFQLNSALVVGTE